MVEISFWCSCLAFIVSCVEDELTLSSLLLRPSDDRDCSQRLPPNVLSPSYYYQFDDGQFLWVISSLHSMSNSSLQMLAIIVLVWSLSSSTTSVTSRSTSQSRWAISLRNMKVATPSNSFNRWSFTGRVEKDNGSRLCELRPRLLLLEVVCVPQDMRHSCLYFWYEWCSKTLYRIHLAFSQLLYINGRWMIVSWRYF